MTLKKKDGLVEGKYEVDVAAGSVVAVRVTDMLRGEVLVVKDCKNGLNR
jgi:hypothetical protein